MICVWLPYPQSGAAMPRFSYTAIEQRSGRTLDGLVEAASEFAAAVELKRQGLAPLSLLPVEQSLAARRKPPPKRARRSLVIGRIIGPKALAVFTRQLSSLLKAQMPLLRSIEVLERQEQNVHFKAVLSALGDTVRSGGNFSEGLQQHPKVFDRLYVNMVRGGEAGGLLAEVLVRLAQLQEKSVRLHGRIRAAMAYPLVIMLVAVGIVCALMVFVVPKFEEIFATTLKGQPLPLLTEVLITVSHFLKNHMLLVAGSVAACALLLRLALRHRASRRLLDAASLRVPVLGDLWLKTATARFARSLGTLLPSGVPILDALRIAADTSENMLVAEAIRAVHDRVKGGDSLALPLRATRIFPDMVASMIEVGEETGALPEMLLRIADNYDEEVDQSVAALTSLLEPLMIVVMALVVGSIILALFLPIVRIIQTLS